MNFSPAPTIVTMKLGSNAQSAMRYILINFKPYKAIGARDIEPSPLKFQKFNHRGKLFILEFLLTSIPLTYRYLQSAFVSHRSDFIWGRSFERYFISEENKTILSHRVLSIDILANFQPNYF